MAETLLTVLVWTALGTICLSVEGQKVQIHAEPTTIEIGYVQSMNITCTPNPATENKRIFSMQIVTKDKGQTKVLVDINEGETVAKIIDDELSKRATAQGQIDSETITNSFLSLVMNSNMSCADATVYACELMDSGSVRNEISSSSVTITARADPEVPTIEITPVGSSFQVEDVVNFKCSGVIGNPPGNWTWHTKESGAKTWIRYSKDTLQPDHDFSNVSCKYNGRSVMTYTVKDGDNGKRFRCSVNGNTHYSAETTGTFVGKVTSSPNPLEETSGTIPVTWIAWIVPVTFVAAFLLGISMPMIRKHCKRVCKRDSKENPVDPEEVLSMNIPGTAN